MRTSITMERREASSRTAPYRSLAWGAAGALLVVAGLVAGAVGVYRWQPCFFGAYDPDLCGMRQSGEMDLGRFNVLPEDLRQAAVWLAAAHLLAGLLWLALLLVGRQPLWRRSLAALGGVCPTVLGLTDLWWFGRGEILLGRVDEDLLFGLALVTTLPAAALALTLGGGWVVLLALGLLAGGPVSALLDYPFWSAFSSPWDLPPGYGLVQAAGLVTAGAAIVAYPVLCRHGWPRRLANFAAGRTG